MQISFAGLRDLGGIDAASISQILDRMAAAGFSGLETNCRDEKEADELATMLRDRGLAIGFSAVATDVDDLISPLELAHRMRADYLSLRVLGPLKASPDIAKVLEEMYELANDAGLPLLIETRAGSVTQDLRRSVKVVNRFKKIRFAGDFIDYLAASKLSADWNDEISDHFRQIAKRCGAWRGILPADAPELTQQIKKLWVLGMVQWLNKAQSGDVLPFNCEPDAGGWEQCLAIKRLLEEIWTQAKAEQGPQENHVTVEVTAQAEIEADQGIH
jgi:hypothetical protein